MKIKHLGFIIYFLFVHLTSLKAQDLEWIQQIKNIDDDIDINDVVTDAAGNVYIGGSFDRQTDAPDNSALEVNFFGSTVTVSNEQMGFLAKVNSSGVLQWMDKFASPSSTVGYSPLAMYEKSGFLYVAGSYDFSSGSGMDFDPGVGTNNILAVGNTDFFVAKYSTSTGAMSWAYAGHGGGGSDLPSGIVVDNSDNVYVCGQVVPNATAVDFDIKNPTGAAAAISLTSQDHMYLVKYDASGNFQWRKNVTNSVNNSFGLGCLAIDLTNSYLYMTGGVGQTGSGSNPSFWGTTLTLNAGTAAEPFLAKVDFSGVLQWVKLIGSNASKASSSLGRCVDVDGSGNVYVVGSFAGTIDTDPSATTHSITSAGSLDGFVSKYTSAGAWVWAYSMGGTGFGDQLNHIQVANSGDIFLGGNLSGVVDCNPQGSGGAKNVGVAGKQSIFFGQYNSALQHQWAYGITDGSLAVPGSYQEATSVTFDVSNSPHVAYVYGYQYHGTTQNFNPSGAGVFAPSFVPKTATGTDDNGFLAKYSSSLTVLANADYKLNLNCNQNEIELTALFNEPSLNSKFYIEKSANGFDFFDFYSLDNDMIFTSKNKNKNVNVFDKLPNEGPNYYRIKEVDLLSNQIYYSNLTVSNCLELKDVNWTVFPNTFSNYLNLNFFKTQSYPTLFNMVDMYGRLVKSIEVPANTISSIVDVSELNNGIYVLLNQSNPHDFYQVVKCN